MGVTPDDRELLGAYALDALDDQEVAAVEALLERDSDSAREVERLREAAAWIAATEALAPPRDLRSQLFERAQALPAELRVYRQAVARHEALLDSIPDSQLDADTVNGLSVGDLVVHLASMESAVAETVGLPQAVTAETDVDARTDDYLREFSADPLGAGRRSWRTAAATLDDWATSGQGHGRLPWNGFAAGRRTILATRAFELWTHDDDIRVALGRDREAPTEPEIALMSDVAVGILPYCVISNGEPTPAASVRMVLTGAGGGSWDVSLDGREHVGVDVTVTMNVVDYCRRVADRITIDECAARLDGDVALGQRILACATALATL